MKQLTESELRFAAAVKVIRSQVRLKMSIAADRELNYKLPEFEKRWNAAIKAGQEEEFVLSAVTEVIDEIS